MSRSRRAEVVLLILAACVTVGSGALMRRQLLINSGSFGASHAYAVALSLHLAATYFALLVPFICMVFERLLALRPENSARTTRIDEWLRWVAVGVHGVLLSLVIAMSIEPAVSGLASLIGPLALLLVVIRTIMVGRAAVTASPLWLATIALGLVTLIAWLVPVGLASIWTFLAPSQPLVDASFRPFVAIGLPVMMTSLSLAVVLASASPPEGASHRVLAVILGVVVSGAWVARWLVLDADVEDSYATVGLSHVLLVAPVAAYFYHARLPRHPTRRMQWGTALGFAPLVAVGVAEVMLGLSGMPRRYSTYDTTFTAWHLVATSAWLAFFVHLAIWHFAVSRARRLEVTIEDLA